MRFSFAKGRQKIFKRLSCVVAVMMSLLTFSTPVTTLAQDESVRAGTPSERGITPVFHYDNDQGVFMPDCISVKFAPGETPEFQGKSRGDTVPRAEQDYILASLKYSASASYCNWDLSEQCKYKVEYVHVKGGNQYNSYDYSQTDYTYDNGLHSPEFLNNGGWHLPAISHVTFYLKVKPVEKGNIIINKTWVDSENKIISAPNYEGKLFTLKKSDGTVVNSGNPINGVIRFDNLNAGPYILEEKSIPGFSATFKVDGIPASNLNELSVEKNKDTIVDVQNKKDPMPRGSITVNKSWEDFFGNPVNAPATSLNEIFTLTKKIEVPALIQTNGQITGTVTNDNKTLNYSNLDYGTYILKENKVEGYIPVFKINNLVVPSLPTLDGGWMLEILVNNCCKDITIDVENHKIEPKGTITVNKNWVDYKGQPTAPLTDPLSEIFTLRRNVVPTLAAANNEITGTVSSNNKTLTYGNLCFGSYELMEKELEGFTPVFKVNGQIREAAHIQGCGWFLTIDVCSEQVITIDVVNIKDEPKGEITVSKKWVDFQGHEIDTPKISLVDIINLYPERPVLDLAPANDGISGNLSQDNKSLTFINLQNGKYILKESKFEDFTPEFTVNGTAVEAKPTEEGGWQLELTVDGDHKEITVHITNRKADPEGKIIVSKTWVDYKDTPIGALDLPLDEIFTLTEKNVSNLIEKNNDIHIAISDENDFMSFENLNNGTYILKEKKLDGYTPVFKIGDRVTNATQTSDGGWEIELNINADSKEIAVDVTNKKDEPKAGITVKKTWTDRSDKSITGPEIALTDLFTLKNEKGDIINGAVLKNGVLTWEGLSLGTYTLEEKKVDGYETSITLNGTTVKADKVTLTLNADKQLLEVNVTNKKDTVPVIVPVDSETPLPKTDMTFEEEFLIIVLGILAISAGVVLRFRRKDVK